MFWSIAAWVPPYQVHMEAYSCWTAPAAVLVAAKCAAAVAKLEFADGWGIGLEFADGSFGDEGWGIALVD